MRTKLSPTNPFLECWHFGFVFEMIPSNAVRILDYGCGHAKFGVVLSKNPSISYVGIDKSIDMVKNAPHGVDVRALEFPLPFKSGEFDVVIMCEVLEHIADQSKVLKEIYRVLRPGGILLVTVPRKHLFSILDTGNLKFHFPRLHKWFVSGKYSKEEYQYRFVKNPSGLIGDIEMEKQWHQHFSEQEISELLKQAGFRPDYFDGYGFFRLLFTFMSAVMKLGFLVPSWLRHLDCRIFHSSGLLCRATKP